MNAKQLAKDIGETFRLRPIVRRVTGDGLSLEELDDQWRLDDVLDHPARIRLHNAANGYFVTLEADNVIERRSPDFLLLRCQLTLRSKSVEIEPINRGAPIFPKPVIDKFVSLDYVERVGIAPRLKSEGFALYWIRSDQEAEWIDLDGWTYVEQEQEDRTRVRFKVRDPYCGYLVLVMKR